MPNANPLSGHPMPYPETQVWRGVGVRAIDGDTFDVLLDQGFDPDMSIRRVRLDGADAWERKSPTLDKGNAARNFAAALIEGQPLRVTTRKAKTSDQITHTFERYIAKIELWSGVEWHDFAGLLNDSPHRKGAL